MERLNKYIAASGICSRRKADELIAAGKVKINGVVVTELGTQVGANDKVLVNNQEIDKEKLVYYVLNKPTGYISTVSDELGRRTVMELFSHEAKEERIFPVGRLDYDTAGVLLFTNDGEFANMLISPASEVEKEYLARVEGIMKEFELIKLIKGVEINGVKTKRCKAEIVSIDRTNKSTLVKLIIKEGKYHQVRLMLEAVGHKVKKLTRLRFGSVAIDDLPKGAYRPLRIHEIKTLYSLKKK